MNNRNRDIFLSEFWAAVHSDESLFSEEAISFVEENLMAQPILTDTAKAILYYLQENEKKNNNFTLMSDCAKFLHTTGVSLNPAFKALAAYGLVIHNYVGNKRISGYSLTEKGRKYNPLGESKDIKDVILSIIE